MPQARDHVAWLAVPSGWACSEGSARRAPAPSAPPRARVAAALALGACSLAACASSAPPPVTPAASEPPPANEPLGAAELARAAAWNYSAPVACPSEAQLFEQIVRRVPSLSAADVARAISSSVEVDVHESAGTWRGRVSFESAGGAVAREVTGAGCDEVVEALALITSLWLRPDGEEGDATRGAVAGAAAPAPLVAHRSGWAMSAARAARDARAGADPLALDAGSSLASAGADRSARVDEGPRAAASELGDGGVGARALAADPPALAAVEPEAASATSEPGIDSAGIDSAGIDSAGIDSAASDPAGGAPRHQLAGLLGYSSQPAGAFAARLQLERWGSPSVSSWGTALGVVYAGGRHENDRLGGAALRSLSGQLELCPPGLALGADAWLRACALGRAGALHFAADTARVSDARSLWRPWAAAGASVHAGVPVSASLSLRLLAELSLVLVRDEFATARATPPGAPSAADVSTFYEISPVSFDVGLGAAHVF